jgi:hypothetical protein
MSGDWNDNICNFRNSKRNPGEKVTVTILIIEKRKEKRIISSKIDRF